ncbi:hypothetical protein FHW03_001436 [Ochrobactrum sp. RH2CCR150]|nr:hypothetical protein [Ochrobactrum sp. RH2CCR150]
MTIRYRFRQKDRGHSHPGSAPAQYPLEGEAFKRPYWRGSLEVAHHNTSSQHEVKINTGEQHAA